MRLQFTHQCNLLQAYMKMYLAYYYTYNRPRASLVHVSSVSMFEKHRKAWVEATTGHAGYHKFHLGGGGGGGGGGGLLVN